MKTVLSGLSPAEIATQLKLKPYQGRQIFRWIQEKQIFDFQRMTDLPKELALRLSDQCLASHLELKHVSVSSASGTRKVLFGLHDGETIESVLIRDRKRTTLCLSSQVGCALKCNFCATGMAGFRRNLSTAEIIEQALLLLADEHLEGRTPNIVFMGMGEPFRNYDAVMQSIGLLMHSGGLGIGARKIALSTVGEAIQIEKFALEEWQVRLSISLHAANDALRSELVPLNKRYPLARLRQAVEHYAARTNRQVTFEWILLDGVNDSPKDAREFIEYTTGLNASVNLIPWNPVKGCPYEPSPRARCESFRAALLAAGLNATLRQEKGQDIKAACGQLRSLMEEESATGA